MRPSIGDILWGALTLDQDTYVALVQSENPFLLSIITLILVGASWIVGHCAILFLNQVPPRRFLVTASSFAGSFVLGALVWVGCTWLVATLTPGDRSVPLRVIVPMTAFAYAPLMLSVLVIIPYVGAGIEAVLNTWSLLALVVAVSATFEVGILVALAFALLGWVLTRLLPRLAGGRLSAVFDNAWYRYGSGAVRSRGEEAAGDAVTRLRG